MSNDKAELHRLEQELADWQASPEGAQVQKDADARRLVWETLDQLRDHPVVQASPRVLESLSTILEELHGVFMPADVLAVTQKDAIVNEQKSLRAKEGAAAKNAAFKKIREHILSWCDNWKSTHPNLGQKNLAEACATHALKWNDEANNPFNWRNEHDASEYIKEQLKPGKRRVMRA